MMGLYVIKSLSGKERFLGDSTRDSSACYCSVYLELVSQIPGQHNQVGKLRSRKYAGVSLYHGSGTDWGIQYLTNG